MEDEQIVKINVDILTTKTDINCKLPIPTVADWAKSNKKTGQLIFHLSQGGTQKIELVETTKIKEDRRVKVRESAGV